MHTEENGEVAVFDSFWFDWSGHRRWQQNPDFWACLLPLTKVSFIRSQAEAAKSWFWGTFAAFDPGRFHGGFGGGIKILLLRHFCCLWSWWVSSGLRLRQQIWQDKDRLVAFCQSRLHQEFANRVRILCKCHIKGPAGAGIIYLPNKRSLCYI